MAGRRKNGTGTVRKRIDGRWEGRIIVDYDDDGNAITKNALAKSRKECLEKLEQLKEQYIIPVKKMKPDMPFGQWIDFWYQNYCKPKLRETTQGGYEGRIYQHIIPGIGKIPLNALTRSDLQKFYSQKQKSGRLTKVEQFGKGLSNSMVRHIHANCRSALEKAVQEGLIRENPAIGCKLPPKKAAEMKILTPEEIQRFLIQAKQDGYFELFLLELGTGMRIGEILGLQWKDLNFKTGELKVRRQATTADGKQVISVPKTKSSIRSIMLPPGLTNILKEYSKTVDSIWMFPSTQKEEDVPMTTGATRRAMKRTLERAGCKVVRFHDLRHTFATTALEHGMDVKTLSASIGHISAATTLDIYSHITDQMQVQAAARIDRTVPGNDTPIPEMEKPAPAKRVEFVPYKPNYRKSGTGMVRQINEHLWEGRYSPKDATGKRISKNVYAKTQQECELKLAELIPQMKAEIAQQKQFLQEQEAAGMAMTMC